MLASLLLATSLLFSRGTPPPPTVALRPLGDVDSRVVKALAGHLESYFGAAVIVLPAEPMPESAYYPPRRRYRADKIVDYLDRTTPSEIAHVLGVTSLDISVTKGAASDWGVFGVSELAGRPGVVSTYRLKAGGVSETQLTARLELVAAHELGHSLGLPHCPHDGCLMRDVEGSIHPVDTGTGRLCDDCWKRLASAPGK